MRVTSLADAKRLGIKITPEIEDALKSEKESKYHNQITIVDGIRFDSQKEANDYSNIKLLQRAGEVISFERQVPYLLQTGYYIKRGAKPEYVRPIKYIADFVVTYRDGRVVVVDSKGFRNQVYSLKKKMLLEKYPEIIFEEW